MDLQMADMFGYLQLDLEVVPRTIASLFGGFVAANMIG
jgi:hypothetical protein